MKACSKCQVQRPPEQFPSRPDRPSGRGTVCLSCGRAYRRSHYLRHVPYYLAKARRSQPLQRRRSYERLIAYLRTHPCVDCGESDVRVLQFDHLDPSQKTAEVSNLMRRGGAWQYVLREIEKCAVRCGNCHRRKTVLAQRSSRIDVNEIGEEEVLGWHYPPATIVFRAVSSADRAAAF